MIAGPDTAAVRTCVGCRKKGYRTELLRLVLDGDTVVVDPAKTLPGRGAWIHDAECLETAITRKALVRALRAEKGLDGANLTELKAGLKAMSTR